MPLATETLRLSTAPRIGRCTSSSQVLRGELAHALALGAEHQRQRPGQVELVDRARRVVGGADDADVALLQLVQRAREVGDHEVRHRLGGAARDLGDGGVEADRVVLGRDHRMRAGAVGRRAGRRRGCAGRSRRRAPAAAAALRPRSSVSSSEWPSASGSTRATTPWWRDACRRAAAAASSLLSTRLDAGLDRARDEVLHARVAPRRVDVQLEHRARRGLQPHAHRVEAEQDCVPSSCADRSRAPASHASAPAEQPAPQRPRRRAAPAGAVM